MIGHRVIDAVQVISLLTGNIERQRNARSCTFQVDISARVHLFSCRKFRSYSALDCHIMSRDHRFFFFQKNRKKEDDDNGRMTTTIKAKEKLNID